MKIPAPLDQYLKEQLADQETSDDSAVLRGSALGHACLGDRAARNDCLARSLALPLPPLDGLAGAREVQHRGAACRLLRRDAGHRLAQADARFTALLEAALPELPHEATEDVATEPLRLARQARASLAETAFLRGEWVRAQREGERARALVPKYLLHAPHRDGLPVEVMARGIATGDDEVAARGLAQQEEFLNFLVEQGWLLPWQEHGLVPYTLAVVTRRWLAERP